MVNYIIIAVIASIIGGVCFFIRKEKKKGVTCIGCPHANNCGGHCSGCTSQK